MATRPNTSIDGVGCLLYIVALGCGWLSYEIYHWMRQEEFPSFGWFLSAIASVSATILASMFLKGVTNR